MYTVIAFIVLVAGAGAIWFMNNLCHLPCMSNPSNPPANSVLVAVTTNWLMLPVLPILPMNQQPQPKPNIIGQYGVTGGVPWYDTTLSGQHYVAWTPTYVDCLVQMGPQPAEYIWDQDSGFMSWELLPTNETASVVIHRSYDLVNWQAIQTNDVVPGSINTFQDWAYEPVFYRVEAQ